MFLSILQAIIPNTTELCKIDTHTYISIPTYHINTKKIGEAITEAMTSPQIILPPAAP